MYTSSFPAEARNVVDLRSDTVTRPTPEMFEAMQSAPLGDDVLGDEPTVARLERLAAETTGKEAALFVPSGTMGNQIALACHCQPGDAILIEEEAHILYYEVGGPALLAGVVSWTLPSTRGIMDPDVIERHILKRNLHTPGTTLLCLENTHNRGGGSVIPLEMMQVYKTIADEHGVKVHLDGARVFNAAVALDVPVQEIAQHVHSVNFCLSKGLRSPVGSLLCGDADFIDKARVWRKRLGGGMRQAGILAACGIVSLTKMVDRLAEDHAHAQQFAAALQNLPGLSIDMSSVQTNMVLVNTDEPAVDWQSWLEEAGLWCFPVASNRLRLVFHGDIDQAQTDRAIELFKTVAQKHSQKIAA
jgi:threonine aldolase